MGCYNDLFGVSAKHFRDMFCIYLRPSILWKKRIIGDVVEMLFDYWSIGL